MAYRHRKARRYTNLSKAMLIMVNPTRIIVAAIQSACDKANVHNEKFIASIWLCLFVAK
jgi:hypothetical protein